MRWPQYLGWIVASIGVWSWHHGRREWLMDEVRGGLDSIRTGLVNIVIGLALAVVLPWVLPGVYE